MENTKSIDVIDFFESSFADKVEIPEELENIWLLRAIARYSIELSPLNYDRDLQEFDKSLELYEISALSQFMKQYYQERYVSLVNKRVSIVGKDLSWDGTGNTKKYAKEELDYINSETAHMVQNMKLTAYN